MRLAAEPRHGGGWVALGLLLYAAVWLALLAATSLSPPTDNIEQLTWLHSLEWGYYKHPPLPTWLLWLPAQLFGANAWTSYATGAALTLAAMGLMWRLLARLRGRRHATLALLAMLCITYYNGRLYYYNHNVVLMFFASASAALCWQAHSSRQLRWWAALGVALGLGLLAKYQVVVTMTSVFVFWLSQRGWRDPLQRRGLWLALLIVLVMFTPHLLWLSTHDFAPFRYANETSLGLHLGVAQRWTEALHWLVDQVANRALPAWALLAVALYASRRSAKPPDEVETAAEKAAQAVSVAAADPQQHAAGRALLLCWGLTPLLFMPLVVVVAGAEPQLQWGTPFMLFAVPAAMEWVGPRGGWARLPLRPALIAFAVIQGLLLLLSQLTSPSGPAALRDRHWRSFDSPALAALLEAPARQALSGGPICVVSGPPKEAGALALRLTDRPLVLIDGRYDRSPWVSAELVQRCGVLELRRGEPAAGDRPVGPAFPELSWRVVPPQATPAQGTRGP